MMAFLFGRWKFLRWEEDLGEGLENRWVATLQWRVGVFGVGDGRLITIYSGPYWRFKWCREDGRPFNVKAERCKEFRWELEHREWEDERIKLARALEEGGES